MQEMVKSYIKPSPVYKEEMTMDNNGVRGDPVHHDSDY